MADQAALPADIAAQDKGPGILAAIITVSIISTLFVCGRLVVRLKIIEKMSLDDYFIIVSTVSAASTQSATTFVAQDAGQSSNLGRSVAGWLSDSRVPPWPVGTGVTFPCSPPNISPEPFCGPWWASCQASCSLPSGNLPWSLSSRASQTLPGPIPYFSGL